MEIYEEMLEVQPIVKEQTTKAASAAEALVVSDQPSYDQAAEALSKVKAVGKLITGQKEAITKPLNASLKAARDLFRPFEDEQARAEQIIKSKMLAYYTAVQDEARKKEAQLQARVERGTMKAETAFAKTEIIERVAPTKGISYRTDKVMRIIDLKKIPAHYFIVDEVKLRRDALALGTLGEVIPGVLVEEIKTAVAR